MIHVVRRKFGTFVAIAVAYLGFQKGGPNVLWPLVLTQKGVKPSFPIFYYVENFFLRKWGHGRFGQGVNTPLDDSKICPCAETSNNLISGSSHYVISPCCKSKQQELLNNSQMHYVDN